MTGFQASNELLLLVGALVAAGALAGFFSGLLGIGGGGVLVPILYEAFGALGVDEDARMHVALGTAMAVVAPTVLRSLVAHHQRGAVDWSAVSRLGPAVAVGVVVGVVLAGFASSETLRWVWVVAGSALALKMVLGREDWSLGAVLPQPPATEVVGVGIGALSTLMGIGGATFTVPFLTLYGVPILRAVATATAIGAIVGIPAAVGYVVTGWNAEDLPAYSLGYVNAGALLIIPVSVLAAPLGVRVAHGISRRALELSFAAFLVTVAGRFFMSLID